MINGLWLVDRIEYWIGRGRLLFSMCLRLLTWAGLTVMIAYGLAFLYVAIIGTITERSEFNEIVGSSMLDEFYYFILPALLITSRKYINSFIRSTIFGRK